MSCFIVSNENLSILSDFIYAQNNYGFNYTGLTAPDSLQRIFYNYKKNRTMNEKEIFETLYKQNLIAYDSRYGKEPIQDILPDAYKDSKTVKPRNISKDWYFVVYKKLQCYLYQLAEDGTIDSEIYKCLTDVKNRIASAIISDTEEYKKIEWN